MIYMSHHGKEENRRLTPDLVKGTQANGIAVEAESGRIEGEEDGLADIMDLEGLLIDEATALEFEKTGIQFLAPAYRNLYGLQGKSGPQLDFDNWIESAKLSGDAHESVLHGTSDFQDEVMKKCIVGGVTKVNLNKLTMDMYTDYNSARTGRVEFSKLMEDGIDAYQTLIEH